MQAYQVGAHFRRRFEPDNPIGRVVGIGLFRDLQHRVKVLGKLLFAAGPIRAYMCFASHTPTDGAARIFFPNSYVVTGNQTHVSQLQLFEEP